MNTPELDASLFQLEAAIQDPYFEKLTQKAKEMKELVDEWDDLSDDEAAAIVAELDNEVAPCIQAPIQCFGYIYRKVGDEVQKVYYEGNAVFNGYTISEDPDTYQRTLMYHMFVPNDSQEGTGSDGELEGALAHLDMMNIEFDIVSVDRARAWLGTFTPELLEEVDVRVLNAEGTEADAIMALKDFKFDLLGREDYAMAQKCLNTYVEGIIQLDDEVPYSCHINGDIISSDENGQMSESPLETTSMVFVRGLKMYTTSGGRQGGVDSRFYLEGSILAPDRRYVPIEAYIPIDSIENIVSLRSAYYDS